MGELVEKQTKERIGLSPLKLGISIVLSVVVWWFIFKNIGIALVLIGSILVHEYGHYFWMGREGIKKRDMFMVPPLGAMAISREPFRTYGIEGRMAIAGPASGIIAPILFFILFFLTKNSFWAVGVFIASAINIFNLLPIVPLDGGRIFRAVLVSLWPPLLWPCFATSAVLIFLFSKVFGWMAIVIWVFLFLEFVVIRNARASIPRINAQLERFMLHENFFRETDEPGLDKDAKDTIGEGLEICADAKRQLNEQKQIAEQIGFPERMGFWESMKVAAVSIAVVACHFSFWYWSMTVLTQEILSKYF